MARNTSQASAGAPVDFQAPEGFQRSGSANAVGWFDMTTLGNKLHGQLIGMFRRKDQLRTDGFSDFFQVEVSEPCMVRSDRGEEAKIVEAKAGDVVNVNYGPKTKPWEALCDDIKRGAKYEVLGCIIGGKVKLNGGKTMHNFDVYQKMTQAPLAEAESDVDFDGAGEASA